MNLLAILSIIVLNFICSTTVLAKWGHKSDSKKDCENGHCYQKCYPTPHAMEGPFYVPGQPFRRDVREGKEGIPLQLELNIMDFNNGCKPVVDADVHIWQPDAMGVYSAYLGLYPLGKPGSKQITGNHVEPTDTSTFLRGIQKTDEKGKVTFMTVYPGWYLQRALHIHFKVFVNDEEIYTGEVYFPKEISDKVAKVKPYVDLKEKRAENEDDFLFIRLEGFRSVVNITGDVVNGFVGVLNVGTEIY
ncbi:unnamed protein product [Orchesella dallaii]|uniref:Uncharacterized protein n=1 Tax=Orchesella dallaii TaxID=48710 RepID=A0ABP1SA09_9HEXA